MVKLFAVIFLFLLLIFGIYGVIIRPWFLRWGTTTAEETRPLPGDELVPAPRMPSTRAVTIHAPVKDVWPWLVQLGYGRAGWYNHDWINHALGAANYYEGHHSSNRILPQFQNLKVGDTIPLAPNGGGWTVMAMEPERVMVLLARMDFKTGKPFDAGGQTPAQYLNSTQVYVLETVDDQTTRFIVRDRLDFDMGVMGVVTYILEPGFFIQESAFMLGVKKRAETMAKGR